MEEEWAEDGSGQWVGRLLSLPASSEMAGDHSGIAAPAKSRTW